MSASQEKKNRIALRSEGNDKKLNAAAEKDKKDRKFRRNAIIAAIIVVIVIAAAIVINSNLFYTRTPAVTVNDTKYSAAETNCYYQMAYNSVYNQYYQVYGDYVSYFLDPSKPLSEQQYSEDQTWAEYLGEVTLDNMKQITALYDDAVKNGYQLSAEDQATIDEGVEAMRSNAISYGYDNLDAFLAANYGGKGMTEKLYRDILTKTTLAYSYAAQVEEGFTYTDDELKAYYAEHKDDFDLFSYEAYYVGSTIDAFADLDEDAQIAAAHDAAAQIADADTVEAFEAAIEAFAGEGSAVGVSNSQGQAVTAVFADWLKDAARQPGDTTVADADTGSYAVIFVGRDDNNYNMVNMHHILVNAEADENGEYTAEALAAAEAEAQSILTEWQANPNVANFETLAMQYSDDTGSNTVGGLYEDIYHHRMVENIDAFLFDEARQPGDTTVVYGTNGSYEGYHVVYFDGEGGLYCDYLAENQLVSEAYTDFITTLKDQYTVTTGNGMKFVNFK